MAIAVPIVDTEIGVAAFGKPVADALNNRVVGERYVRIGQTGIGAGAWVTLTNSQCTFVAVANTRYRVSFGATVLASTPGAFAALALYRAGGLIGTVNVPISQTNPGYGHGVVGIVMCTKLSGFALPAGTVTLELRLSVTSGTTGTDAALSPVWICVEDVGSDP